MIDRGQFPPYLQGMQSHFDVKIWHILAVALVLAGAAWLVARDIDNHPRLELLSALFSGVALIFLIQRRFWGDL